MKKILFLLLLTVASYGQTYQNPTFGTITSKTSPTVTSPVNLVTQDANGTQGRSSNVVNKINSSGNSGIITFDGLAINADPTKFNLGAGTGYITNSLTGVTTAVSWSAQTAQTTPYLATSVATYVLKDSSGATVLQNSYPTNEQFRTHIYLGKLAHTTFTTISVVVNDPSRSFSVAGDFHDFVNSIGSINIEGNAITPNGANLNINVSAGRTYREGANFMTNRNSPNITNEPAVVATSFRNKFRNGSGGWSAVNTTTVDPNNYDNGSGILQLVPNNKFTIKVVYRFGGSGTIHMDYGQAVYDDMAAADAGIANSVASDPDTKGFASRIGWIIIKQGTTSLLDATKYKFVAADLFGTRAATSAPVATLQTSYDASVTPQIVTNTTGGAVAIRRGSAADSDNILVGQNGAGTNTFSVTGNGNVTVATPTASNHAVTKSYADAVSIDSKTSKGLISGDSTIASYAGQNSVASYLVQSADISIGNSITDISSPGNTIADQKTAWLALSDKNTYDYIVVQIGLNDIGYTETDATVIARLQDYINTINSGKNSNCKIIISTMTPCKQRWIDVFGGTNGLVAQNQWIALNEAIKGNGANPITGVDTRISNHTLALADNVSNLAPVYDVGDHIHENNAAREIIASSIKDGLNFYRFLKTLPPKQITNYHLEALSVGNNPVKFSNSLNTNGLIYNTGIDISGSDLNNIYQAGFYVGQNLVNAPDAGSYYVTVESASPTYFHQTITGTGFFNIANDVYSRTIVSGVAGDWEKIPFSDSPTFTGTPTAPTATAGTNTTQIATTAFVQNAVSGGTFTPTLTNVSNIASVSLLNATYTKTGDIVTATIGYTVTYTSNSVASNLRITLPVARSISSVVNIGLGSVSSSGTSYTSSVVQTDSNTTEAIVYSVANGTTSSNGVVTFQYSLN